MPACDMHFPNKRAICICTHKAYIDSIMSEQRSQVENFKLIMTKLFALNNETLENIAIFGISKWSKISRLSLISRISKISIFGSIDIMIISDTDSSNLPEYSIILELYNIIETIIKHF